MPLDSFFARPELLDDVRRLVAEGRAQRTLVLAGPEGVGKTTLALMIGLALNCLAPSQPGDFCGRCASCREAAGPDEGEAEPWRVIDELVARAGEYRAAEVKTNPREAAPLVIAPHPWIRVYPPDGDFLTMPQARAVIHQTQLRPDHGRGWALILPEFDRARWTTQAALLKTLEEPPPRVALLVLARNPLALLPTVRSRALTLTLPPLAIGELAEKLEAVAGTADATDAGLRAALAAGCPGRALTLDAVRYREERGEALEILNAAVAREGAIMPVISLSEATRSSKEKFESLTRILYSVMQDIVYLQSGYSEAVRNVDCIRQLQALAARIPLRGWIAAIRRLDGLEAAQSRNVFRPLGLASWALQLRPR